jgi:hypothetical protein
MSEHVARRRRLGGGFSLLDSFQIKTFIGDADIIPLMNSTNEPMTRKAAYAPTRS